MKNIYLIQLIILFSYSAMAQTTYPSGVTGCIARWTFDSADQPFLSSLPDMSGNNNNGTPYSIATAPGFRNKPFKAGAFDGSTSWAEVADKAMLNPSNITIVALVKFNEFNIDNCQGNNIIYKGFDYFTNVSWSMCVTENDGNCSAINHATEKLYFTAPNITPYSPPSNNYIDSNKWYFLAVTYNGSIINFYQVEMDSVVKATNINPLNSLPSTNPLGNTTNNVFIGATQNPPFKYWYNGYIDEIALFNKALSNSEIQSVYDYLWGWSTGISESDMTKNDISLNVINNKLNVTVNFGSILKVEIRDLSGNVVLTSNGGFDNIDLSHIDSQLLVVSVNLENNQKLTRMILN